MRRRRASSRASVSPRLPRATSRVSANDRRPFASRHRVSERRAQDVLDFWFGANPMAPEQIRQRMRLWFGGDEPPELRDLRDETLGERFGTLIRAAGAGQLDAWAGSPHRLLALVL